MKKQFNYQFIDIKTDECGRDYFAWPGAPESRIYGGTIRGGNIWGGTIKGGNIYGGTIWGGTIKGGIIYGGTIYGGTIWAEQTIDIKGDNNQ